MRYYLCCVILMTACAAGCNSRNTKQDTAAITIAAADTVQVYGSGLHQLTTETDLYRVLCQNWWMEEDLEMLSSLNEPQGIIPIRSLHLFADSTFTQNIRNYMEQGRWRFDAAAKKILLRYKDGSSGEYKLAALAPKKMIVVNTGIDSETKLTYVANAQQYVESAGDPFHTSNNQWRIKPRQPETEAQLRERIKAFLHFHILFYRDNIARAESIISFYGFPTCLKWYAGGIYMIKKEELSENWFGCFYNKDQAMKGYAMMEDIIGKKYNWPKDTNSWVKKNLAVLEQMYANL
ncbi:MAG TPA: hypothetical protein PKC39_13760 [Ferruginibacter sp.]|nr:hypothetical protein [Ferruginibacter sp.]HMP22022.1 hypothetical protein [Ferruginibacter sp.]